MSELINNGQQRLEDLNDFARGLLRGGEGRSLFERHKVVIETVTPVEAMQVLDKMLAEGLSVEMVKAGVGKIINAFYKSLSSQSWERQNECRFLTFLMLENREAEKIMLSLKELIKQLYIEIDQDEERLFSELRLIIKKLGEYELHFIKKENILFPYIERVFPQYRCLKLMWSFHDDFRKIIKNLEQILLPEKPDKELLSKELGKLFFVVLPVIFREERIIFPVAERAIPKGNWETMMSQSFETGWCFIDPPKTEDQKSVAGTSHYGKINLVTGFLSTDQLILVFNNLPVDITFVDENDEVCYFSGVKQRIFPRSKAIIGRKIQNCHPHESVHIVNEIIDAFRSGEKDHADFWIQMKQQFIHIRYFAVRDETGAYKGTIEVSQDVTEIRDLKGERRLLDW